VGLRWLVGGWRWVCQLADRASANWQTRPIDHRNRRLPQPSPFLIPAPHRPYARHHRHAARVFAAQLADHAGRVLPGPEPFLGVSSQGGPGVRPGTVSRRGRLGAHGGEVIVQRTGSRLGQTTVGRPQAVQGQDEVAAAALPAKVVAGVAGAEPHRDTAPQVHPHGLPARALDADRADLTLRRRPAGLVQRRQHPHQSAAIATHVSVTTPCQLRDVSGMALPSKGGPILDAQPRLAGEMPNGRRSIGQMANPPPRRDRAP